MAETVQSKPITLDAPASAPKILSFPLNDRPKTNRRQTPKSRTGCITCKKRRVRCDEGKPSCLNCSKSKRSCEGYAPKTKGIDGRLQEYRPLLIRPNYETYMFTAQLEKDHFEYWMTFSKQFTLFPSDLVTQLIPQIAREEPAIKHAAFAIGAATLGSDSRRQRTVGSGPFMKDALQHYGRAIHIIRSSASSKRSIPRALLSCILFVTFESIQGNHLAALTHINHGCTMLDQVMKQGVSGECPPKLIDEVISGFQRFTLSSWTMNGYHPPETEAWVPWCCRGKRSRYAVDELPKSFATLSEAHRWWEIIQHFIIYQTKMHSALHLEDLRTPTNLTKIPKCQVKRYMGILDRWRARFQLLTSESSPEAVDNEQARLQMLSLQLLHKSLVISVKSSQFTNKEVLLESTEEFSEILAMSRMVLEGQLGMDQTREVFTMDSSPSWAILCASIYCVDADVRNEAHCLLRDFPRRDGIWDTRLFAAISKTSQDLRAENDWSIDDHFGAVLVNKEIVLHQDEVCRRKYKLADGKWRIVEEQRIPVALE
ncbi:C6 zinc finger protein [Colletotrichum orchidophilum]|uniref:C6 zinc finger protein n=1 Tax=Colletotrichum orchidophilum TaxID=1209926 RepID=A0A1G4BR33_9PEZI|nr:C6 zinc finger protein [Colletotrichum orchidophilum]OHF03899.1 C6 zinc finger protein [Colletotrichum orchidophilum]